MGKWATGDRLEQSWELQSPSGPISAVAFVVLEMRNLSARFGGSASRLAPDGLEGEERVENAAKSLTKTKAVVFGAANEQL